jgi:choline dehydrogenase
MQATERMFDYIVIGAGSAGCALAARLSEQSKVEVLLIEAGKDAKGWTIRMPLAVDRLLNGRTYNWGFETEPEAGLQGRSVGQPRGRVVGGSSAINGMVYTRGNPRDYDEWAEVYGCDGWDYARLLPYFRRMETAPGGDPRYRGSSGPLKITRPDVSRHVLNTAFIEAGRQSGHPVTEDHNGRDHEGFTVGEQTIHSGQRCSTAAAYLTAEVRARPNLTILPEALVERVLFQDRRAVGVLCRMRDGQRQFAARCEIVLSAGAVGTPHLLNVRRRMIWDSRADLGAEVIGSSGSGYAA